MENGIKRIMFQSHRYLLSIRFALPRLALRGPLSPKKDSASIKSIVGGNFNCSAYDRPKGPYHGRCSF